MEKSNKLYTTTWFITLGALLCCALWGSATPFIQLGYKLMLSPEKDVPSIILFAGTRFTIAGIITVIIYSIGRRKFLLPKKGNWGKIAIVSCFQTVVQYIFFYIGLANTIGVKGTVASSSSSFFAMLIACLLFRQEKLTFKKVFACILGFAGIILVNLNGLDFNMNFLGDGFVIFSAIASATSSVFMKIYSTDEDPVVISGYQFIMGGLVLVVIGLIFGGSIHVTTLQAVGVLVYLAFLSAIAYAVWGILLKHNPVSKITIFSFTIPVFGVLLSILMLGNKVNPINLLITLALVCSGIILLNHKKA
ncbi:MAG: DMT family transporter [Ruminococcaceae bacterium]|nr:DMT family transporter [Oscillospiraceae bacterium]